MQGNNRKQTMYDTEVKVWSNYGNTPITKRGQSYCDELVSTTIQCATPEEARKAAQEMVRNTAHGYSGWFHMPAHPNQNMRGGFVHK
ncbi:hypothetical protein P26059A_0112 [Curvibacter phage P26059A]|nr:hypothetical protein P26059A_0112 [Curvibacter phage P26059A]